MPVQLPVRVTLKYGTILQNEFHRSICYNVRTRSFKQVEKNLEIQFLLSKMENVSQKNLFGRIMDSLS